MIIQSKKFKIFDSDALKKFHKRIFFSIVVFLCCYFLAVFRIADVMILEIDLNKNQNYSFIPERGKIYDRNGQLLSTQQSSLAFGFGSKHSELHAAQSASDPQS